MIRTPIVAASRGHQAIANIRGKRNLESRIVIRLPIQRMVGDKSPAFQSRSLCGMAQIQVVQSLAVIKSVVADCLDIIGQLGVSQVGASGEPIGDVFDSQRGSGIKGYAGNLSADILPWLLIGRSETRDITAAGDI